MNNQACFSGRQTLTVAATVVSPAKAGWRLLSIALPRAALRSTSFRYACPGLNSSAGFAGSLNSSHPKLTWLSSICVILVFFSGCNQPGNTRGSRASADSSPAAVSSSADVVKITSSPVSISQDSSADAVVTLSISPGFHINANPATFPYLIATEVKASKVEGITVGTAGYPAPERKKFQFAEQPLAVFEGEVRVKLNLRAEKNAAVGPRTLPIAVRIQACDNEQCFPPATVNATIAVDLK
jgi:hypothetical protein